MIPEDAKARRQEAMVNAKEQTQVDEHFHHVKPEDKPVPYSDQSFKDAAVQWLIETDQVCDVVKHQHDEYSNHLYSLWPHSNIRPFKT